MYGSTHSSLQSSNTLNYRRIELASLYTVTLSAVYGLSRLTKLTTSKEAGTADSLLNRIGRPIRIQIESQSFAGPYVYYSACTKDLKYLQQVLIQVSQ